ncbi:hypothetical protein DFH09DRAFT_1088600 [Mycena vulgaris]|nr:hypothetical protein DFH09DRAFT_1088600 [Mycena vulgaris]
MSDEIRKRTEEVEARLHEKLQVSFTFNTWTSQNGAPYLGATGHYIGPVWIINRERNTRQRLGEVQGGQGEKVRHWIVWILAVFMRRIGRSQVTKSLDSLWTPLCDPDQSRLWDLPSDTPEADWKDVQWQDLGCLRLHSRCRLLRSGEPYIAGTGVFPQYIAGDRPPFNFSFRVYKGRAGFV